MQDIVDKLARDVEATTIETSAKVAEIHHIKHPGNDYQRGYNQAVADIAAQIRKLK